MTSAPSPTPPRVADLSEAARSLWAKSGDDQSRAEGEEPWLSLPQHMLDSAGVAGHLWESWATPSVRTAISRETRLDPDSVGVLVKWLACVHDVGKAFLTFQGQLGFHQDFDHFLERLRSAGLAVRPSPLELGGPRIHHSLASMVLVQSWLERNGVRSRIALRYAGVLDAHHGAPSRETMHEAARSIMQTYTGEWAEVHEELLEFAADLTGIRTVLPSLSSQLHGPGQMLLTGLVIMADWIASNAEVFPLTLSGVAEERSHQGISALDLTAPWQPKPAGFAGGEILDAHLRERFGWPTTAVARPVQSAAATAAHALDGPGLMIIEAPTGEGKTEAALVAAEILAESSGAGGAIIAAPTMSTADGLFRRVLDWARKASGGSVVSMFLAHSKSRLNPDFRQLRSTGIGADDAGNESDGDVIASQWMSGRKKGVLSTMSVATVDQVLFLALQSKHSMLRHLGLAGKVVIIDEVHAYDAYMSEYMATALAWLARYRVPVVLLSATLPAAQKRALLDAYRSQISNAPINDLSTAYPLVTTVGSGNGLQEIEVASRPSDLHARLELVDDDLPGLTSRLVEESREGGCILLICNTVRRAQEAYQALSEAFAGDVELHHAAFVASHRAAKETALRAALGPDAHRGSGRPERRIVVATQVAEQSLDIDVDLLVTDIAPIDLLIQRIGRLHRHDRLASDRPRSMREPQVLIRAVASTEPPVLDKGSTAVYGEKLLLATLAVLLDGVLEKGFERPTDIAPLVHRVYSPSPPIPDAWREIWEAAETKHASGRRTAEERSKTYRIPEPSQAEKLGSLFAHQQHSLDSPAGEERGLAQVRDSDPSVEVIPILRTEYGYRPLDGPTDLDLSPDQDPGYHFALRLAADTVRLPGWMTRGQDMFEKVLDQLETSTPAGWQASTWLKGQIALPLDAEGGIDLAARRLVYDQNLGLRDVTEQSG